jgi:hypothetical protein
VKLSLGDIYHRYIKEVKRRSIAKGKEKESDDSLRKIQTIPDIIDSEKLLIRHMKKSENYH